MPRYKKQLVRVADALISKARALKEPADKILAAPLLVSPDYTVKKFSTPTCRQVVGYGFLLSVFSSAIGFSIIRNDPLAVIAIGLAIGSCIALLATAVVAQRLDIKGPTIKISTATSFYRYRQFHAKEVEYLRLNLPQGKSNMIMLQIALRPSSTRKWNQIFLCKYLGWDTRKSINCPRYIALIEAIRQAQPGVTVQNLPSDYSGPLGETT